MMPDPANSYARDGYAVIRSLDLTNAIDDLLAIYAREILTRPTPLYRKNGEYQVNQISAEGYMLNPLQDPHMPRPATTLMNFSRALLNLATHPSLIAALEAATGGRNFFFIQSMMFDANPGTDPHQDCYYLDSIPSGHLTGVWVALEDIHPDSGPLYVLPRSLTPDLPRFTPEEVFEKNLYMPAMRARMKEWENNFVTPRLNKGEAIFWSSHVLHGSHPTRNTRLSRKSLALHYLPEGYDYGTFGGEETKLPSMMYNGVRVRMARECQPLWPEADPILAAP